MEDWVDLGQIDEGEYQTVIRGHFLHYWSVIVDDHAKSAATWTFRGAPAGLSLGASE